MNLFFSESLNSGRVIDNEEDKIVKALTMFIVYCHCIRSSMTFLIVWYHHRYLQCFQPLAGQCDTNVTTTKLEFTCQSKSWKKK